MGALVVFPGGPVFKLRRDRQVGKAFSRRKGKAPSCDSKLATEKHRTMDLSAAHTGDLCEDRRARESDT